MDQPYLTIAQKNQSSQVIKKSEFIGTVAPVHTEEEAQAFIASINDEHKKATHNCFAYMIGDDDHIQRASDNGEPSGTAGVPILEVLKNNHLHDVAVVVTRYFGGIKLGAGGLIRAYSSTTAQVIEATGIVQRVLLEQVSITLSYSNWNILQNYLQNTPAITQAGVDYGAEVTVNVLIPKNELSAIQTAITLLLNANFTWQANGATTTLIPYQRK